MLSKLISTQNLEFLTHIVDVYDIGLPPPGHEHVMWRSESYT